ncbi:MAG: hypothetical protein QM504_14190 [Pseudomonadota bacterium]
MRFKSFLLFNVVIIVSAHAVINEPAKYIYDDLSQQKILLSKEIVYTEQIQETDLKQFQLNNPNKHLKTKNTNTILSTLTVGPGCTYSTLQAAVDAASSGDVIRVRDITFSNGDATVNVTNKSLIINGGYGVGCNTLSGNRTTLDGAGQADSLLEFSDSSGGMTAFVSNVYIKNGEDDADYGGGIEVSGNSSNPLSITLSNVKITNSQSARGGAIHMSYAGLSLVSGTIIYNNTAIIDGTDTGNGGGIYCLNSNIELLEADIGFAFGNTAQDDGGGIYLDNCDLVLNATSGTVTPTIRFNSATDGSGGGVYATNTSRIDLHGDKASISANNAKWGGGVSLHAGTKLWGDNGKINNNTASLYGGGFIIDGANTVFDMDRYNNYPCSGKCSELSNNQAFKGGAGYIGASSAAYIESSWIEGNTASQSSVGFHNAGTLSLKNSMLLHNQAQGSVSQLVLTIGEFASTTVQQSTIADSHLFPTTSSLFDVTISTQASLTLDSNIIWENDNNSLYSIDNSQTVVVENNILQFNHAGSNLQTDPLFLVPGSNYHISPLSPAVDFANASLDPNVKDIDAENRDLGVLPDAGADEAYLRVGVADSGCAYTSITEAIAAASDGDTIYISPGNYIENPGLIDKSLTLTPSTEYCNTEEQLASSDTVIVDGANLFRTKGGLFEINNSSSVLFKYMTLKDAQANNGGIIHITDNSTLQLVDVYLHGGMASQSGGGIYSNSGSDVIMHGTTQITSNTASIDAGGVYIREANLDMNELSTIGGGNGNTAGVSGGGLYIESSTVTMSANASINDNQAQYGGGVHIFSLGLDSNIINGEIKNNTATTDGGGIYVWSATASNVDLNGVNINNNTAQNGAGIFYNTNTFGGQLTASLTTISQNDATNNGGGIMISGTAAMSLFAFGGSGILGNTAVNNGGGINIGNDTIFTSTNFGNLIVNGNSSGQKGGAIYLAQNGGVHIDGGSLSNNFSINSSGGGIYSAGNNATIELISNRNIDMTINNNRAVNGFGGAIRQSGGTLEIGRSLAGTGKTTVSANTASGGGALDVSSVSIKIIGDIQFLNNTTTNLGGAINANSSNGRITNYTNVRPLFAGNTAAIGGALFFGNGGPYQILGVDFGEDGNGNQAQNNGGAIYLNNVNNAELINLNINHNSANGIGGGLYIEGGNTLIDSYMSNYGYPGQYLNATIYGGACSTSLLIAGDYCSSFDNNTSTVGAALTVGALADVILKHTVVKNHNTTAVFISDDGLLIANGETTSHFDHNLFTTNTGNSVMEFSSDNINFDLSFNTFSGNSSTSTLTQQGLVNVNGTVNGSIFWGNSSGNNLDVFISGACNITQDNSLTGLSVDPLFDTQFQLTTGSPAIDACSGIINYDLNDQLTPLDGDGLGLNGNDFDMGAFEYQDVMVVDFMFANGFE